jgi:hypothetical protein
MATASGMTKRMALSTLPSWTICPIVTQFSAIEATRFVQSWHNTIWIGIVYWLVKLSRTLINGEVSTSFALLALTAGVLVAAARRKGYHRIVENRECKSHYAMMTTSKFCGERRKQEEAFALLIEDDVLKFHKSSSSSGQISLINTHTMNFGFNSLTIRDCFSYVPCICCSSRIRNVRRVHALPVTNMTLLLPRTHRIELAVHPPCKVSDFMQ